MRIIKVIAILFQILLIVAKISGIISNSWWIVLLPLWTGMGCGFVVTLIALLAIWGDRITEDE